MAAFMDEKYEVFKALSSDEKAKAKRVAVCTVTTTLVSEEQIQDLRRRLGLREKPIENKLEPLQVQALNAAPRTLAGTSPAAPQQRESERHLCRI